jgi:uncharacterized protein
MLTGEPTSRTTPFHEAATDLIACATTLILATADATGPWSAPVYYVFVDGAFYFFSSPQSRHVQQALSTEMAAASIFHQSDRWEDIRGVQMKGRILSIRRVSRSVTVIDQYLKRFPFTKHFFPTNRMPTLDAFFSRFNARLYAFVPTSVFYTDNRFGFATRKRILWNVQEKGG